MFEDVDERDRTVGASGQDEGVHVHGIDGKSGAGGSKCRRARVELDPLGLPARPACQMQESAGVRPDVEQLPAGRLPACERIEDRPEDEILIAALEFLLNPLARPELIVQAIEESGRGREAFRLREPARAAAAEPDRLTGIRRKIRMLLTVDFEIEYRVMHARERCPAAHPTALDINKAGMAHDSANSTMSRDMSSHVRDLRAALNRTARSLKRSRSSRHFRRRLANSVALFTSSTSSDRR